jgi:hypothetical protein
MGGNRRGNSEHVSAVEQGHTYWTQYSTPTDLWIVKFLDSPCESKNVNSFLKLFIGSKLQAIKQAKEYARTNCKTVVGILRIDQYQRWTKKWGKIESD